MVRVLLATAANGSSTFSNDAGARIETAFGVAPPTRLSNESLSRLPASLSRACFSPAGADGAWARVVRRWNRRSLASIGVLGCSTTAGCGALSPARECSMPLSWGRHAHDALADALTQRAVGVETSIYQKNAVEASFFFDCTHQLLPERPDVVILEILQNMYALSLPKALNHTVAAIRRVQPSAVIVFAVWLKLHMLNDGVASALRELATANSVDVVDTPAAMSALGLHSSDLYARVRGKLDHHPNAMGHELIGMLTGRCVARRLERVSRGRAVANAGGRSVGVGVGGGGGDGDDGRSIDETPSVALPPRAQPEACYGSADLLPVVHKRGFVLQDDGADKGVKKLGYSSTHVGDKLTLGPVRIPVEPRGGGGCHQHVRVRLGYLVSTTPGMGRLYLQCAGGCSCRPVKSTFLRSALPFPRIEASARLQPGWALASNESITMTAHTVFIATLFNTSSPARQEARAASAPPLLGVGAGDKAAAGAAGATAAAPVPSAPLDARAAGCHLSIHHHPGGGAKEPVPPRPLSGLASITRPLASTSAGDVAAAALNPTATAAGASSAPSSSSSSSSRVRVDSLAMLVHGDASLVVPCDVTRR